MKFTRQPVVPALMCPATWGVVLFFVVMLGNIGGSDESQAGEWMFRRSYYSHQVPPEIELQNPTPRSRSAYRGAYVGINPGFSIQGGYRFNRVVINSGNSSDVTILRRNWFEITP